MIKFELLKKAGRSLVIPLVVSLLSIFLFFLVVIPKINQISELDRTVKINKEKLAKLRSKLADLKGIDENALKEKVSLSSSALPVNKDVMQTISVFNGWSENLGINLEDIDVSPGEIATESPRVVSAELENMIFKLTISGQKEKIQEYLAGLEQSLPLLNLDSFKINNVYDPVQCQLVVESYSAKEPLMGKTDNPLAKLSPDDEIVYNSLKDLKAYKGLSIQELVGEGDLTLPSSERSDPFSN